MTENQIQYEKRKEYFREYGSKNRAKRREYLRLWRKNNPDKIKKYEKNQYERSRESPEYRDSNKLRSKKWREDNPQKVKDGYRKYYETNKQRYFESAWKRIHKKRALKNGGMSDDYTRDEIYELHRGLCIICGSYIDRSIKYPAKESFTIHHVIPISRGGNDTIDNVAPAHWKCNLSVGNKMPDEIGE